jgi:hypothetical protein
LTKSAELEEKKGLTAQFLRTKSEKSAEETGNKGDRGSSGDEGKDG